ncbi:aromatic ring-hydroxylating oxygenase subunit alpha [Sphingomonas sp. IC081]|uniref:aromatic ring-hydroxylating oxygenase subunit alpha n=1 Tax=Sphingomonas sp. IC081 TaxID=304378 RepID=UPI00115A0A25|nr:aromatic ring-hydroxylating dioxygenase subunit alpha [Sphingomonas sp. IC081]QDK35709.1 hypothetical protein DM450_23575 [Sphingomonas sp. IC081]
MASTQFSFSSAQEAVDPRGVIKNAVESGKTLPSSWYSDEDIFQREQRTIFRRAWEYVGHKGRVGRAGDYFTCEVGGVPLVIVCGNDNKVRAFHNICRHRHHPVANGSGNQGLLICNYHAWTYELDGSLRAAPRSRENPSFDKSQQCLKQASVAFLGDMVFVNPMEDAPSLSTALGPIEQLVQTRKFPMETARFRARRSIEFNANWKIVWDNNCECYHCPTVHPAWYRSSRLDPKHMYTYPVGPLQIEGTLDLQEGSPPDYVFFAWPTICFMSSGGQGALPETVIANEPGTGASSKDLLPGFVAYRIHALGVRQTRIEFDVYTVNDLTEEQADEWLQMIVKILSEDREVCEGVQRGHDSGIADMGTLLTAIDSEFMAQTWERLVYRAVTDPDAGLYDPILEPSENGPANLLRSGAA